MSECTALLNWSSLSRAIQMLASAHALHLPTILCLRISDLEYRFQDLEVSLD